MELKSPQDVAAWIGAYSWHGRKTTEAINNTAERFRLVARRGSQIFFIMNELVKIHTYYIYTKGLQCAVAHMWRSKVGQNRVEHAPVLHHCPVLDPVLYEWSCKTANAIFRASKSPTAPAIIKRGGWEAEVRSQCFQLLNSIGTACFPVGVAKLPWLLAAGY